MAIAATATTNTTIPAILLLLILLLPLCFFVPSFCTLLDLDVFDCGSLQRL